MRDVAVPPEILAEMKRHALESFPEECCGFLIGPSPDDPDASVRRVTSVERAANVFDGERRRRFLIRPEELIGVERRMEREGRAILGFYHSHPNHPAQPSQFDQDHAWPWYSYLVLSVDPHDVTAVAAFELDPDAAVFREVGLRSETATDPAESMTRG